MRRPWLFLFAIALLAAPTGSAWASGELTSVATRNASIVASEVVLQVHGGDDDTDPHTVASRGFALAGEQVRLDWFNITHQYTIPKVGSHTPNLTSGNPTQSDSPRANGTASWNQVRVVVDHARNDPILFLSGFGDVGGAGPTATVNGHDVREVVEETGFGTGRELERRTVATLHQTSTPDGIVSVKGDFLLAIFNWDLRFSNLTNEETYRSGSWETDSDVEMVNGSVEQNLYLHVTNGTLTLPLNNLNVKSFYVGATSLDASSAVLTVANQETAVNLNGPLRLALSPVSDGAFDAALAPLVGPEEPAPDALSEAGSGLGSNDEPPPSITPSTTATTPASGSDNWPPWLLTSLALLLLALVAWRITRVLRLRQMMRAGQYQQVAASEGMEGSRAFGAEIILARVVALVKTNDLDGAAALLERRGARLLPSVSAYLWACIHAGRGDEEEARSFVIKTIMADPSMAVEVASNGKLRGFLADLDGEGYS